MSDVAFGGACYGFAAHSQVPLLLGRRGQGTRLEVTVNHRDPEDWRPPGNPPLLLDWLPPAHPFEARLYGGYPRFELWVSGSGWFLIDTAAPSVSVPAAEEGLRREERLWGLPALLCFAARGDLGLHAAAVEIDGRALLIAGPGRHGKTTLAAALARRGHRLLAEDLTCVRTADRPEVIPGPTVLRLRGDALAAVGDWGQVLGRDEDRAHVRPPAADVGDCTPVPLGTVVLLRGPSAPPRLQRATRPQAMADLWSLAFHLPDDRDRARAFAGVATVADAVETWRFSRSETFDELADDVERLTVLHATAQEDDRARAQADDWAKAQGDDWAKAQGDDWAKAQGAGG